MSMISDVGQVMYTDILSELSESQAVDPSTQPGWREVVVDKTGIPRQAGSSHPEGEFILRFRRICEKSLFVFGKAVMGRGYFTSGLHMPVCNFLQKVPPFRKCLLMPRDHAKTSIVSHCLPPHILIQPAAANIYFPGIEGCECRIMLAGSSAGRAEKNLGVVSKAFTSNTLMRALWPHRCYDSEKHAKAAAKWNDQEIVIPRQESWPDASVFAVGVGVEVAGARPNVQIKDDIIGREAANSDAKMRDAIDWHIASRALADEYEKETALESLEFIIGTRWAVFDVYSFIQNGDGEHGPDVTVEMMIRRIVEPEVEADGSETGGLASIWPQRFNEERIDQLRTDHGSMFHLLYMNDATDPDLVDFDVDKVRLFELTGPAKNIITFEEGFLDLALEKRYEQKPQGEDGEGKTPIQGIQLTPDNWDLYFGKGRGRYMRLKYG